MMTPDPLPQPGAWLVMPDGSLYEIDRSAHDYDERGLPCVHPPADRDGVRYVSVDSGESIWTPWADVYAVGTYSEVDAISAAIVARYRDALMPEAPETVARYVVTIRHRQGGDPYTPAMLRAVADVMAAALRAAGIPATATVEPKED